MTKAIYFLFTFILLLTNCAVANQQNVESNASSFPLIPEAGKCYVKCAIPNEEIAYNQFPIYTGSSINDTSIVEKLTIEADMTLSSWQKTKVDKNCKSPNPDDCLVWTNVNLESKKSDIWIVKDTMKTKDFVLTQFPYKKKLGVKTSDWLGALCENKFTPYIIGQIQKKLYTDSYYKGDLDGKMSKDLMEAVTTYQQMNNLPIGALNFKTLNKLGIDY